MIFQRYIQESITQDLTSEKNKVILVFGARQVGKTTLVNQITSSLNEKVLIANGDQSKYVDALSSRSVETLENLVGGYDILFVDEAQRIPEIGLNLKILHDSFPKLKIIVTGSSVIHLASETKESLAGRSKTYQLYPVAQCELKEHFNSFELTHHLEDFLVYGSYPEVINTVGAANKIDYLEDVVSSYLYKDILEISNIKHSSKLVKLLKLLAFQIGQEISLTELGTQLSMSKDTVDRYISLLEDSFVVYRLGGLSRNLRKEVSKKDKIYFYDLGVRNFLINNVNSLNRRDDVGHLWENFLINERMKWLNYSRSLTNSYFWRTHSGAEVDLVEESDGAFEAFEYKWNNNSVREPKAFLDAYKNSSFSVINQENYLTHVGFEE